MRIEEDLYDGTREQSRKILYFASLQPAVSEMNFPDMRTAQNNHARAKVSVYLYEIPWLIRCLVNWEEINIFKSTVDTPVWFMQSDLYIFIFYLGDSFFKCSKSARSRSSREKRTRRWHYIRHVRYLNSRKKNWKKRSTQSKESRRRIARFCQCN